MPQSNESYMRVEKREFAWEFSQLSWPGQTRTRVAWELRSESLHESFLNSHAPVKREQELHESWEARVCVRVFSTLMPRSNENKSCMRVDESWEARVCVRVFSESTKLIRLILIIFGYFYRGQFIEESEDKITVSFRKRRHPLEWNLDQQNTWVSGSPTQPWPNPDPTLTQPWPNPDPTLTQLSFWPPKSPTLTFHLKSAKEFGATFRTSYIKYNLFVSKFIYLTNVCVICAVLIGAEYHSHAHEHL
jgi:hypothetical protein